MNLQCHCQEKTQMGLHHLSRTVHKNTFAWFSVNLVVDNLLNKEEQHYNNSWQMLFPLTLKFLKPLQKHMQNAISFSADVWFQAETFWYHDLSVHRGYFYIIQMHTNHKWQENIQQSYLTFHLQNKLLQSGTCTKFLKRKFGIWDWG